MHPCAYVPWSDVKVPLTCEKLNKEFRMLSVDYKYPLQLWKRTGVTCALCRCPPAAAVDEYDFSFKYLVHMLQNKI
jgi:hypothetical protein